MRSADGLCRIGGFEGGVFHESGDSHPLDYGEATYAGQTWSGHPENKRVHISWIRGMGKNNDNGELGYCGMPFSQCMSIPCELTLSKQNGGFRVLRNPAAEFERLRDSGPQRRREKFENTFRLPVKAPEEYLITLLASSPSMEIRAGSHVIRYDPQEARLYFENGCSCPVGGAALKFRILADTTTLEIFFDNGIPCTYAMSPEEMEISFTGNGEAEIERYRIKSIWG